MGRASERSRLSRALADEAPVLCLLDDAHWFDRSSAAALLFAARRLRSDPVVVILAARDGDRPFPADGVESLTLPRFDDESAALLLAGLRRCRTTSPAA